MTEVFVSVLAAHDSSLCHTVHLIQNHQGGADESSLYYLPSCCSLTVSASFFLNSSKDSNKERETENKRKGKRKTRKGVEGQYGSSWRLSLVWHEKPWELRKLVGLFWVGSSGHISDCGMKWERPHGAAIDGGKAGERLLRSKLGEKPLNKISGRRVSGSTDQWIRWQIRVIKAFYQSYFVFINLKVGS